MKTRWSLAKSRRKYPRSRYCAEPYGTVVKGMFADQPKPFRNILRLYWPRFPGAGPGDVLLFPWALSAKRNRRVRYWARQLQRRKYLTTATTRGNLGHE